MRLAGRVAIVTGAAGGIAAGLAAWRAPQVMAQSAASASGTAPGARGEFVLRGGHVLSMDARVGDLPSGDVHVRNGVIVAVGVGVAMRVSAKSTVCVVAPCTLITRVLLSGVDV